MKLLGIDYGTKNIGLAIGETGGMALPFGVIENISRSDVVEEIQKMIDSEGVGMIVLGLPQTASGIPSKITKEVLDFGEFLSKNLSPHLSRKSQGLSGRIEHGKERWGDKSLPIKFQNEQFTSKEVEKLFRAHKKERKGLKKDAVEAMVILQSYIDQN